MIKPPLVTFCSILGTFILGPGSTGTAAPAVPNSVQSVAEREIVRRQDSVMRANEAIVVGDKARKQRDYDTAIQQYRVAVDLLPESATTHDLRRKALTLFCQTSVKLANQRISEGRFADAEATAKAVLVDRYDPTCHEAIVLLANLQKPDYFDKGITPKFRANVEQVRQWLIEAKAFYDTGRYDLASKRYDQVLNIDPYNVAARKGHEKVDEAKNNYAISAYDEARAHALWQVEKAWERPIHHFGQGPVTIGQDPQNNNSIAMITAKLNKIVVPNVEFKDATVREAIDFLKKKSVDLDTDPEVTHRGVNIVLQMDAGGGLGAPAAPAPAPSTDAAPAIPGLDAAAPAPAPAAAAAAPAASAASSINPSDARITLSLHNVPLMEVLKYITSLAGLKVKIDPYAVSIVPLTVSTEQLITKEYKVPPGFITNQASTGGSSPNLATATKSGSGTSSPNGPGVATRRSAKDFLEENGIQFPTGASANFLPSSSKLVVRNTQDNLDLVETLVQATTSVGTQVEIESKFVEISQNNLKELSFDWLLGNINLGGGGANGDAIQGSGGTPGTGNAVNPLDYPYPVNGQNPVTSGNRTGSGAGGAISANAIDALLFPAAAGSTSAAPGIASIAGVFTNPQFQMVIRALNQKKGVDLLSSPRVTTKSGQRATMEVVREFKYPTEFNPPQIPQTVQSSSFVPITPTTPTAFETRNTGVTLEVEPVVGPDGATIDLNLVPQVVEFEGFINYGSPIYGANGVDILTPNVINQPIFSTRKVTTSISIWDGQTVVLGGLMREDVQKVEDKVPFLGDMPLVGRLFRSSVDQHLKKNLVIFVTARLINPAGDAINQEEEKEDVVEPIVPVQALPEAPLPAAGPSMSNLPK